MTDYKYIERNTIPNYYSIYLYDNKVFMYMENRYCMRENIKVLTDDIRYYYNMDNKLYYERGYSLDNNLTTYRYYFYDKKGMKVRMDFAYKLFNNITSYELYEYDDFDRIIYIKHFYNNKLYRKIIYKYISINNAQIS